MNYVPTVNRLMRNARAANKRNRQASSAEGALELTEELAELFRRKLVAAYEQDEDFYQTALGAGVPKELARVALPVGRYSRMRAQGVLRNWLAFLTLRKDSNAQWEIQEYANAVGEILKTTYPRTWALFELNHPGTWANETPAYYDHQITKLRVRLRHLKRSVRHMGLDEWRGVYLSQEGSNILTDFMLEGYSPHEVSVAVAFSPSLSRWSNEDA